MKFIGADSAWDAADIVLFGAPFDSTTSYRPGARFGPSAMRAESFGIETYSPLQRRDLADARVHDAGDLELPFGDPARAVGMIEERAGEILDAGKTPFLLGGEHLVTLGAVRAAAKRFPDLCIIHLDAHADLRDDYLGVTLSHACVMRRCHDILGDGRIWQFGIRSGSREEFAFIEAGHVGKLGVRSEELERVRSEELGVRSFSPDIRSLPCEGSTGKLLTPHSQLLTPHSSLLTTSSVYLTVDMDVLDPSEFPGTGTPEAGGLRYRELLDVVLGALNRFHVVALDNVELAPSLDPTGRSTALACKFLREELIQLGVRS